MSLFGKIGKVGKAMTRVLTPPLACTFHYWVKNRAMVSFRAEIDLTPNLHLGRGTVVSSFTKIKAQDGMLRIGERGGVATGCFLSAGPAGIDIGDNFVCGPNVSIVGRNYIFSDPDQHLEDQGFTSKGISIGRNVWLGAGTVVLDGSSIGDNTVVVANSLINRKYPPNVILQGSPAKIILKRQVKASHAKSEQGV